MTLAATDVAIAQSGNNLNAPLFPDSNISAMDYLGKLESYCANRVISIPGMAASLQISHINVNGLCGCTAQMMIGQITKGDQLQMHLMNKITPHFDRLFRAAAQYCLADQMH